MAENELHIKKIFSIVLAKNENKNHLINLTHGCLYTDKVDGNAKGMFLFSFLIWQSMWRHYFAVATGTTISCSLGRWYGTVFSLSFLDVYVLVSDIFTLVQSLWVPQGCTSVTSKVLHSRVGSWPFPQILDQAGKTSSKLLGPFVSYDENKVL